MLTTSTMRPLVLQNFTTERLVPAMCFVLFVCVASAHAADDPLKYKPPVTETKVYDIRDMLVQIPNFTSAPEFEHTPPSPNQTTASTSFLDDDGSDQPSRQEMIEQIVNLIQDTVGEQSDWQAYGGTISSLRELNGNMIVKTTPAQHKQIAELFGQLRKTNARQVATDALYIRIKTDVLEKFKKEHADDKPVLSEKTAQKLTAMATAKDSDIQIIGAVRLLAFNGQRVHAWGLDDHSVPIEKPRSKAGSKAKTKTANKSRSAPNPSADPAAAPHAADTNVSQPVAPPASVATNAKNNADTNARALVRSGATFDIEHTLSVDARFIIMTLRCSVAPANIQGSANRSHTRSSHSKFNTSCMVPNEGGVILSAVSHTLKDDQPNDDREVVLFVRVRVIESK